MLAVALAELLPAALEQGAHNAIWALAGFSTLYVLGKFLSSSGDSSPTVATGIATGMSLTIVGVTVCDFFDGVAVASAAMSAGAATSAVMDDSAGLSGWILLVGLFPHNFLEGASIALLMVRAGMSRGTMWTLVIGLAVASLIGGMAVELAVPASFRAAVQAFAAGLLIHLVATERIPAFNGRLQKAQAVLVVAGIAGFVLTEVALGMAGLGEGVNGET